ncbi:putative U4/U6.U5 tri-snRNP-associated protein 3 [Mucor mucedo]|uniref:putative U4/U6.U5 tri-snRNP-associated protein 3 n=1 Tax=Mucor mucedo TaxID=29922 RepID=UPI00221ED5EC|nr:putative U4/U6.U5 tri-snRNP-associated protein 3 [Mucor mucedo]KAI7897037.1 putative U4/U6.U5 tri-snRNP-associated protein 3 [Mucor mucedo]
MPRSPSPKRYSSRQRERDYRDLDSPRSRSPPRRRRRDDDRDYHRGRSNRSRSPPRRDRRTEKSPDRRDRGRARYSSRSSSPKYRRRRSSDTRPMSPVTKRKAPSPEPMAVEEGGGEDGEEDDEETKMMKLMGFGGFDTTKNKKVPGTDVSGAKIRKPIKYRQYMNRRGGFNRPLDN